jgi:hypothetical protein
MRIYEFFHIGLEVEYKGSTVDLNLSTKHLPKVYGFTPGTKLVNIRRAVPNISSTVVLKDVCQCPLPRYGVLRSHR